MRRFFTISLAALMLFTAFLTKAGVAPASAATISPGCAFVNAHGGSSPGLFLAVNQTFYAGEVITSTETGSTTGNLAIFIPFGSVLAGGNYASTISWTVPTTAPYLLGIGPIVQTTDVITTSCSPSSVLIGLFGDGRVNGDVSQAGQTFAAYCNTDFSITVLAIDPSTGNGFFAFTATPADIAKVPSQPTVNTAIKSGQGATLYRLTGGNFQVNRAEANTGKTYSFAFSCGQ